MTTHSPLIGPDAWLGPDMVNSTRWIREFSPTDLATIDAALQGVKAKGLAWDQITTEDFPLPGMDDLIASVREELENGCGMVKLRTLPVDRYSEDELRQIYFGIGGHVGHLLFQNNRGELMRAIRAEGGDVGQRYGQVKNAGGKDDTFLSSYARTLSNGQLRFHTDRCDVVVLLCVRQARAGGVSKLASSVAIHNVMLERRPDLADALYGDYYRSRFGEEAGGEKLSYPLPVFDVRDGRFTSHYSRTYIESAQMMDGVPKLTDKQVEALDMLHALAEELCFHMTLEPGDIQFLNNHVIYHSRTAFEDDAASQQDRLLYRLWLSMPNSRPLPKSHGILWGNTEPGAVRGGIAQAQAQAA